MVFYFVVCCLFLMVALQIPMPHSAKSRSIKQPSIRRVQTLIAFLRSGSLCPRTVLPLCHNSIPKLIKCSTLCPGIKGNEGSFYYKATPRSTTTRDPPSHLQTLGVVVDDAALPHRRVHPGWGVFKIGIERGSWGSRRLANRGMCSTSTFTPVISRP
jgi:hypothetical protein